MTLLLSLALAAAAAPPPQTDLTATYTAPGGGPGASIKVETSRSGAMRVEMANGRLIVLHRAGHTYLLSGPGAESKPIDIEDLKAATREGLAKTGTNICDTFSAVPAIKLVQMGTATVQGRTGDAWFRQSADGKLPPRPEIVISHDPALAPIGAAMAEEYRATTDMVPDCPSLQALTAPLKAAFASGTPIALSGLELTSVQEGAIDPKRFELSGPPMSREELRQSDNPGR